jgi:mRNA-degrading endonuclease toxin of MazEF toxin-antitoxin module
MTAEGALRRGYIYLAHLDKLRPVLVISLDIRNELASDVIVVPSSSRLSTAPTHVRLRRGDGGITQASVFKCEQVTTSSSAPSECRCRWTEFGVIGPDLTVRSGRV